MKTAHSFLFATALAAAATALPVTASAAATVCDGVPAKKITKLRAENATCATARKVAKGWKRAAGSKGFACGYYPITNKKQIETVRCVKDDAVVTFKKRWVGQIPFPTRPPMQLPSGS